MRTITDDDFEEEFEFLVNPANGSLYWELEELQKAGIPADRIWTYIDGDEGGTYAVAGVHWVNRYSYGATVESHDFDIQVEIESAEDEEARYAEDQA